MTLGRIHHQRGLVRRSSSEAGIVLGPMLFIIAALAIIAVAIAAGNGGSSGWTNTDSPKVWAHVLITQSELLHEAVEKTVIENGCDPTSLSFADVGVTGLYGSIVANNPCRVLSPQGGAYQYQSLTAPSGGSPSGWQIAYSLVSSAPGIGSYYYPYPGFIGWYAIPGVSSNATLVAWWAWVDPNVCTQINAELGYPGAIPSYNHDNNGAWFQGSFGYYGTTLPGSPPASFTGAPGMCYRESGFSQPVYNFYYVLYPI